MAMKLCIALPFLALAACSAGDKAPEQAEGGERIACAVAGSAELKPVCAVERAEEQGRLVLVVHHPDGGFRRFAVMTDGSGLAVADGAQVAVTRLDGDRLDVSLGADRYLFPATRTPDAPQPEPT
ncbi:MAG: hypothetical protein DI555_06215 [Novosphingobium pentaromativorans]|uniref:Lipoprotein n=1 Tax=Novosphingobium pentaromativorans TaxID=205844 RepID=A0A2W5QNH9_9SPHN|nr:MAG: hypothetical protein DI555_06215 [Novosphingobium pentaromativorans]